MPSRGADTQPMNHHGREDHRIHQVRQDAACHFPIMAGTGVFMAARVS